MNTKSISKNLHAPWNLAVITAAQTVHSRLLGLCLTNELVLLSETEYSQDNTFFKLKYKIRNQGDARDIFFGEITGMNDPVFTQLVELLSGRMTSELWPPALRVAGPNSNQQKVHHWTRKLTTVHDITGTTKFDLSIDSALLQQSAWVGRLSDGHEIVTVLDGSANPGVDTMKAVSYIDMGNGQIVVATQFFDDDYLPGQVPRLGQMLDISNRQLAAQEKAKAESKDAVNELDANGDPVPAKPKLQNSSLSGAHHGDYLERFKTVDKPKCDYKFDANLLAPLLEKPNVSEIGVLSAQTDAEKFGFIEVPVKKDLAVVEKERKYFYPPLLRRSEYLSLSEKSRFDYDSSIADAFEQAPVDAAHALDILNYLQAVTKNNHLAAVYHRGYFAELWFLHEVGIDQEYYWFLLYAATGIEIGDSLETFTGTMRIQQLNMLAVMSKLLALDNGCEFTASQLTDAIRSTGKDFAKLLKEANARGSAFAIDPEEELVFKDVLATGAFDAEWKELNRGKVLPISKNQFLAGKFEFSRLVQEKFLPERNSK